MPDLRDLYQEVILDHGRRPRNFGPLAGANRHAEGFNPLCGDQLTLHLKVLEQGVIEQARFEGSGCAISTASASLMTEALKGRTAAEAQALFAAFHALLTGGEAGEVGEAGEAGKSSEAGEAGKSGEVGEVGEARAAGDAGDAGEQAGALAGLGKAEVSAAVPATVPAAVPLGKLAVFSGVREFPGRVKCATLAWHTLDAALRQADQPVTTE